MVLCGISFIFFVGQLINLRVKSSRSGKGGYTTIPQSEDVLGIPTQHYHDDANDDGEAEETSPNPDVHVEISKPKWQLLRISIELITVLGGLALNVLLHMVTHEIGPLVWTRFQVSFKYL